MAKRNALGQFLPHWAGKRSEVPKITQGMSAFERCVIHVKERNVQNGYPPEGKGTARGPTPWAVCHASVDAKWDRKKQRWVDPAR